MFVLKSLKLRLHSGRPDYLSRRLSPIGVCGGRYHSQLHKESWLET